MSADLPRSPAALATVVARKAFVLPRRHACRSHVLASSVSRCRSFVSPEHGAARCGWRLLHAGDEPDAPPTSVSSAWSASWPAGVLPADVSVTVGPGRCRLPSPRRRPIGRPNSMLRATINLVGIAIIALAVYLSYRFASKVSARWVIPAPTYSCDCPLSSCSAWAWDTVGRHRRAVRDAAMNRSDRSNRSNRSIRSDASRIPRAIRTPRTPRTPPNARTPRRPNAPTIRTIRTTIAAAAAAPDGFALGAVVRPRVTSHGVNGTWRPAARLCPIRR